MRRIITIALSLIFGMMLVSDLAHADGKATFETKCAACHGTKGEGKPALKNTDIATRPFPATGKETITNGKPGTAMPAWKGKLSDQEISDVADYIKNNITKK